ncbi:ATP synthase subunit I [Parahaliea sp. F7430]|uniref:ATP synthase subunit I n=1 Tax=Sediminihaliea albiluteola TaxID=2758564 RepID=A0A7W2TXC1_9GAMM|nr:ATP synthase subunit I [Sediminihaliea albiluteola]MBA6413653.1 ATP synthase subunit I [Sediminihaliea albiluteola]
MKGVANIAKPPVFRITLAQFIVLLPLSLLLGAWNINLGYSALCGGLVAILPQAYFAAQTFRYSGARSARVIARSSYTGEVVKFLLNAVGFAAIFILLQPVSGAAVFAMYLLMMAIQITGSWWLLRRASTKSVLT